jgi:hypothetical protein
MSCDSWESNAEYDVVPTPQPGDPLNPINCYLGEHMEKYLTHPYASPLFGDFARLPPLLIQAGEAEVLRDEITLLAHKATVAGVEVKHELYEDAVSGAQGRRHHRASLLTSVFGCQVHVFQAFPFLEASTRAFVSCREFVNVALPAAHAGKNGRAPKALVANAALASEIVNERARVVAGDGGDEAAAAEAERKVPRRAETPSSEEDDDEEDASWSTAGTSWPSPPPSEDEYDDDEHGPPLVRSRAARARAAQHHQHQQQASSSSASSDRPTLARIHSSLSSFVLHSLTDATPTTARPHPRRTPSTHSIASSTMTATTTAPTAPSSVRRVPSSIGCPRTSTMSGAADAPPPRPLIRSSASHADISSLCASWVSLGPANATTVFKHDGRPARPAMTSRTFLP